MLINFTMWVVGKVCQIDPVTLAKFQVYWIVLVVIRRYKAYYKSLYKVINIFGHLSLTSTLLDH